MKVLITGGATGIGYGIARELIEYGDEVVIVGRREDRLKSAAQELNCEYAVFDVVADNPNELWQRFPGITAVVNNAGVAQRVEIGEWDDTHWQCHFDVNVKAVAFLSQSFASHIGQDGAIVNIASSLAKKQEPGFAVYGTSKAAVLMLTKSMALELAPRNIRVNAVLPAVVPTAMTGADESGELVSKDLEQSYLKLHPLGRLGTPKDIGEAVRYLLNASWVTGAELAVDGGSQVLGSEPL